MPRIKRVKFTGYFNNWGILNNISKNNNILSRFETYSNLPRNSWWYKNIQQLILYSHNIDWTVTELCKLFVMLKRLNLQFSDLFIKNINLLSTSDLSVSDINIILDSLVYNCIKLENLCSKLIITLENKDYDWTFPELCNVCYNICKLNMTTSLFDRLRNLPNKSEYSIEHLDKQLEVSNKLGILLDLSNINHYIDLKKCSIQSLILLANHGYFNFDIIVQRLPQFKCSDLVKLSSLLYKIPFATNISVLILYFISSLSHKLNLNDTVLLLKGLDKVGINSQLLDDIIHERIYHWKLFDPPNLENYEYWEYLHNTKKYN